LGGNVRAEANANNTILGWVSLGRRELSYQKRGENRVSIKRPLDTANVHHRYKVRGGGQGGEQKVGKKKSMELRRGAQNGTCSAVGSSTSQTGGRPAAKERRRSSRGLGPTLTVQVGEGAWGRGVCTNRVNKGLNRRADSSHNSKTGHRGYAQMGRLWCRKKRIKGPESWEGPSQCGSLDLKNMELSEE